MKILENAVAKALKNFDFKTLILNLFEAHKDEIKEAIENLLKEAVENIVAKVKEK